LREREAGLAVYVMLERGGGNDLQFAFRIRFRVKGSEFGLRVRGSEFRV
jgi:hypothetical protein